MDRSIVFFEFLRDCSLLRAVGRVIGSIHHRNGIAEKLQKISSLNIYDHRIIYDPVNMDVSRLNIR